jgi:hypothetical protein
MLKFYSEEDHGYFCNFEKGTALVFYTHNAWVVWTIWKNSPKSKTTEVYETSETEIICSCD